MNFSVTTTEKSGVLQACERYTRLGDATITGTTAYLAEFTNYCNETLRELWAIIFKSYGGWQYEDSNQTVLPAGTDTLTSGQTSYALPDAALTVKGIEVKDSSGNWHQLSPITEEEIRELSAMGEFEETSGTPLYYQLVGKTARIYPASNWTQASSFKVFFDRGSVAFETTDTTQTPGFASEFHDLVPLGASCLWFEINTPEDLTYQVLKQKYETKKKELANFYSSQSKRLMKPRLSVFNQDNR